MFYIGIKGETSYFKSSESGTIQGSQLGLILYAIFVSPILIIERVTHSSDYNFIIKSNKIIEQLIADMKKSLAAITKWLKKSGLKVNDKKLKNACFSITFKVTSQWHNYQLY